MDEPIEDVTLSTPPEYPGERYDLICGECQQAKMVLRKSKYGLFYGCSTYPKCDGAHGAHADGAPKGTPANKTTRLARIRAHAIFDRIWKERLKKRRQAYGWMRHVMGLTHSQAHISMLSAEQCEKLIQLVYRDFPQFQTRYTRLVYDEYGDDP